MKRHLLTIAILSGLIVAAALASHARWHPALRPRRHQPLHLAGAGARPAALHGQFRYPVLRPYGLHGSRRLRVRRAHHPRADEGHGAAGPLSLPAGGRAVAAGGDGDRGHRRRPGRGGGLLSADAAFGRCRGHHLIRAAGRALHGDDPLERAHQRAAHAVRAAAGDKPDSGRFRGDPRPRRRAGIQGVAYRAAARASRDDERAAAAMGANIPALRWRAFVLAALFAGVGGALWGHFITSFSPKAFYLEGNLSSSFRCWSSAAPTR